MKKLICFYIILIVPYFSYAVRPMQSLWKVVTPEFIAKIQASEPLIKSESIKLATLSGLPDTIGIMVTDDKSKIPLKSVSDPVSTYYQSFQNFLIAVGPHIPLTKEQNKKVQFQKIQYLRQQQSEEIKKLYNNALLITYHIDSPVGFTTLINAINDAFKKDNIAPRIVIIAYGENASLVNQALRAIDSEKPINMLVYLQSPIYEYMWDPLRGYTNVPKQTPVNFLKLINIYTKAENPVSLQYLALYPDRKYRAQINVEGNKFQNKVINVNAIKINKNGELEELPISDFATNLFMSNLAWLIEQLKTYQVNSDLMAQLWSEQKDRGQKKGSVFVNRFVNISANGDLTIKYGDGQKQQYVLIPEFKFSTQVLDFIKNGFTKELNESWSQLRNIFDTSAIEGWKPYYFGGSKMAADIARIKDQHTKEFNSPLYLQPYKIVDLLNNKQNELQELLQKLDNPVSLSYAINKIILGGDYIFQLLFQNSLQNVPTKTQEEYLQSIIAIMWYLYSLAINKNQGFTEGAFVIEDKDFKLYNFLLGYVKKVNPSITGTINDPARASADNPFAYSRVSSHYKLEQKQHRQYGIDIRIDKNSEALPWLPIGKRHLVFGIVDQARNLLYLKPENYGIFSFYEKAMHGKEFVVAQTVKLLPKMKNILSEPWYKTFEDYIGTDDDPLYRKERVPQEFIIAFDEAIKPYCKTAQQRKQIMSQILHKGIQRIFGIKPSDTVAGLRQELDSLYDYLYLRTGREIILTYDELSSSLYYHLLRINNDKASEAKILFNTIIELKNTISQLKQKKFEQRNLLNITMPPISDLLNQIRNLTDQLDAINLQFLTQWSSWIYDYIIQIQSKLKQVLNADDKIAFTALTGLGTLFDSRLWIKQ